MHRREFLMGSCGALAAGAAPQAGRRPNVVVILADDLGNGDLSCYGNTRHRTPNLDRMAAEGIRFSDFYTPMPFCAPTRSSLLTGRYPFRTTITRNPTPDAGLNTLGLPAGEVTMAEALKPLGYATICIGKWHLGHTTQFLPRTQGFDEYLGILYSNDMRPVQMVHNEKVVEYPVVQADLTRKYTHKALEFMDANRSRPFFLYLPHAMPHKPLAASEDFYTPETPDDLYSDAIRELDWSVGQVLAKVKELGQDNNTLVIFTSDNGATYGGSTGGLRGMKGRSWEGGIRVPMIARWPGRIPAGRTTKEVAGIIDLFPTVLNTAGAKMPEGRTIDGRDLMPLLSGRQSKGPHEAIFAMAGPQLAIVRSGKWKLHYRNPGQSGMLGDKPPANYKDPRGPDGVTILAPFEQAWPGQHPGVTTGDPGKPMMLFDLEADPSEQHDVAAANPEVVARLKALFEKLDSEVPPAEKAAAPGGPRRLMRLRGGQLKYDDEPKPRQ